MRLILVGRARRAALAFVAALAAGCVEQVVVSAEEDAARPPIDCGSPPTCAELGTCSCECDGDAGNWVCESIDAG